MFTPQKMEMETESDPNNDKNQQNQGISLVSPGYFHNSLNNMVPFDNNQMRITRSK